MMYIHSQCRSDRIECECWCFRKELELDVSRPQWSLTNINNNMSFSYRVLSSSRSRGTDLLSILSDTFAHPNPSHKPAGIYEFEECKQQTNIDKVVKSSDKQTGTQQMGDRLPFSTVTATVTEKVCYFLCFRWCLTQHLTARWSTCHILWTRKVSLVCEYVHAPCNVLAA